MTLMRDCVQKGSGTPLTLCRTPQTLSKHGSYRPGGRLCCAGLLEGHVKGVWACVICVGWDGRWGGKGIEGGAGLGVGRRGGHVVLRVVVVVGAGGGRAAVLNVLIHTIQEPQVCVLWLEMERRGRGKSDKGVQSQMLQTKCFVQIL